MMLPPERRYRTSTSHMLPFWEAHRVYWHDPYDDEVADAEWAGLGLDPETVLAIRRAGITCYKLLVPCPDWLLRSIPQLGPVRIAALRHVLPYGRAIHGGPRCPGAKLEMARRVERARDPAVDAYVAEQARRQLDGEPELLPSEAVLSSFAGHPKTMSPE